MKKYIALFSATLILTIGYFLSITIPLAKDNASGLFAIFEDFFDEESYSDTKYIALNPDNIDLEDQDGITYLMKRYCFFHGHTFLFKTFNELIDEGVAYHLIVRSHAHDLFNFFGGAIKRIVINLLYALAPFKKGDFWTHVMRDEQIGEPGEYFRQPFLLSLQH